MKLTMLSHASVLIEEGAVAICADPWFFGEAFNESWSLLCDPAMTSTGLQGVRYIWISHEHPDHLHYPTLKAIPSEQKAKITLLYQEHFSSRMYRALSNLGFRAVVELPLSRWYDLENEVSVLCCSAGTIDSLLAVRSRGGTVLNMNDCVLSREAATVVSKWIGPVDVLLTQFSIAGWVGNPTDTDVVERHMVIERMQNYINAFRPRAVIPFASFVYFSHHENRYMNKWVNTPDYVCEQLKGAQSTVQFLYNGDSWSSEDGFTSNGDSLERYRRDFSTISDRSFISHPSFPLEEILDLGKKLVNNVRAAFPNILLKLAAPLHFYVVDLGTAIRFDLSRGVVGIDQRSKKNCDLALGSQALWYAFKFPWGFGTLDVSGRYEVLNPQLNRKAMYLCHLYGTDISFKGVFRRLRQGRVWKFLWSKRHEILDRLIKGGQGVYYQSGSQSEKINNRNDKGEQAPVR